MQLKSKLFKENVTISEKFSSDLLSMIETATKPGVSEDTQRELASAIGNFYLAPNEKEEAKALEEIRSSWPAKADSLSLFVRIGVFLLQELNEEDTAEAIESDIVAMRLLDQTRLNVVHPFIDALVKVFRTSVIATKRDIATQQFGLNVLASLGTKTDLRAVTEESGLDSNAQGMAASKQPVKITHLVPVGIIHLRFDDEKRVTFQVDYRTLNIVLEELTHLRNELDAALAFVGSDKVRKGRMK